MRAWLVLVAGCYNPSVQPGSPCPDGTCPSGLVCSVTGTCELGFGDADVIDDSSDGAAVGPCTKSIFADDFAGTTADPFWNVTPGSGLSISEVGGVVRAQFANPTPGSQLARYESGSLLDFRDGCAVFEIGLLPVGSGRFAFARVGIAEQHVSFRLGNVGGTAKVFAEHRKGQVNSGLGSVGFDATLHRFLRIRNTGASFVLETAGAAAGPFVLLGTTADTNIDPASTLVLVGAGTDSAATMGSTTAEWSSFALLGQ
ncbi:MAG: hypothetical protein ABI867_20455 [Kofleriaceae bacterium]